MAGWHSPPQLHLSPGWLLAVKTLTTAVELQCCYNASVCHVAVTSTGLGRSALTSCVMVKRVCARTEAYVLLTLRTPPTSSVHVLLMCWESVVSTGPILVSVCVCVTVYAGVYMCIEVDCGAFLSGCSGWREEMGPRQCLY